MHVQLADASPGLPSGRGTTGNPIAVPGVDVTAGNHQTIILVVLALLLLWALHEG